MLTRNAASLFGYENSALPELLSQLSQQPTIIDAYLPEGKLRTSAQILFPNELLTTGKTLVLGKLNLHLIPFLPQNQFDYLLWLCDLNFVRGEESLTRAIWAGKPFVWHIYSTDDDAHWDKLAAFINRYTMPDVLAQLNTDWNKQHLSNKIVQDTLIQLSDLKRVSYEKTHTICQQTDLCNQLIDFVQIR